MWAVAEKRPPNYVLLVLRHVYALAHRVAKVLLFGQIAAEKGPISVLETGQLSKNKFVPHLPEVPSPWLTLAAKPGSSEGDQAPFCQRGWLDRQSSCKPRSTPTVSTLAVGFGVATPLRHKDAPIRTTTPAKAIPILPIAKASRREDLLWRTSLCPIPLATSTEIGRLEQERFLCRSPAASCPSLANQRPCAPSSFIPHLFWPRSRFPLYSAHHADLRCFDAGRAGGRHVVRRLEGDGLASGVAGVRGGQRGGGGSQQRGDRSLLSRPGAVEPLSAPWRCST